MTILDLQLSDADWERLLRHEDVEDFAKGGGEFEPSDVEDVLLFAQRVLDVPGLDEIHVQDTTHPDAADFLLTIEFGEIKVTDGYLDPDGFRPDDLDGAAVVREVLEQIVAHRNHAVAEAVAEAQRISAGA